MHTQRRASGTIGRARRTPTVLVADDDDDLRAALRRMLTDAGYIVIETATGRATLEYLARAADEQLGLPDVMLLDFVLPGFSGLGILRALRGFQHAPATILMTAFPDPSVGALARNLGASRVLRKPVDEDELRDALATVLAQMPRATGDGTER
jgi:CheY-like chemotaxis protein